MGYAPELAAVTGWQDRKIIMHIRELSLLNFGRFETRRFVFAPGVNVITGGSGAGKTTVLVAAATALSGVVLRATGNVCRTREIEPWEVFHTTQFVNNRPKKKDHFPSVVEAVTKHAGATEVLSTVKAASASVVFLANGRPIGHDPKAATPLIVRYGTDRDEFPERRGHRDGYSHWDNASLWEVPAGAWLANELVGRCGSGAKPDGFDFVHWILSDVFPDAFEHLHLWFEKERVLVGLSGGVKPLEEVGDGMKSVIVLAADLARRMERLADSQTLDFDEVTGVVMVDDIGRGLSKARTRRLLGALEEYLPKVQFLVTTPDSVGGDFNEIDLSRSEEDVDDEDDDWDEI